MTTADSAAEVARMDGHLAGTYKQYTVNVIINDTLRHKSEPMRFKVASKRLAMILRTYLVDLGYKQAAGADGVTLERNKIRVQVQIVEVI